MEKDKLKKIQKLLKDRAKAQERGNLQEEAGYINVLGELHTEIGDHDEALNLHKQELGLCKATEDTIGQAVAHRKIGECFAALSNFTSAIKHQCKHLELARLANNVIEQQRAYTTIGRTYLFQGEDLHQTGSHDDASSMFQKAEDAFQSSIRLCQTLHERKTLSEKEIHQMKARSTTNLGLTHHYMSLGNREGSQMHESQSLGLFQRAIAIAQKYLLSEERHCAQMQLAMFFQCRKQPESAITHVQDAYRCAKVACHVQWQIEALTVLAELHLSMGNSQQAKKDLKKSYLLMSPSADGKSALREKLKIVVKISHLQEKLEERLLSNEEKFKAHETIADKFCDLNHYQAAISHYKCQEDLLPLLENSTEKQKASVYYSLAQTSSDQNDNETAISYYKKELEFSVEPKGLAKTWTQIGVCMEKLDMDANEIQSCYDKALQYAEETSESKLQLNVLNLQLEFQQKRKLASANDTRQKLMKLELKSGYLLQEAEEDSEDILGDNVQMQDEDHDSDAASEGDDSEAMLERELGRLSDDSDEEDTRKSRSTARAWKRKLNEKGETALHRACIEGHLKRVQLLLEQGHPVNEPDFAGWTPLHEACNFGFTEIVRILLDRGAKINYTANEGTTPIQDAAHNGHCEVIQLLLARGADPKIRNKAGKAPLKSLEDWFQREENLEPDVIESYWETHNSLSSFGGLELATPLVVEPFRDLEDSEISTQHTMVGDSGMTESSYLTGRRRPQVINGRSSTQSLSQVSESGTDFAKVYETNTNCLDDFPDSLPELLPRHTARTPTTSGDKRSILEYKSAVAGLGSSDSIAKRSGAAPSRAPKRPSIDSEIPQDLLPEDDYVGDDWLIDDASSGQDCRIKPSGSEPDVRPAKRPKTIHLSGTGQTKFSSSGWRNSNMVGKNRGSGSFSSSFLNRSGVREVNSKKRMIMTKIKDFMADTRRTEEEEITIHDDDVTPPSEISHPSTAPRTTANIQSHPSPTAAPTPTTMRVKVKINGKMFLIAVPGSVKTVAWLCERAAQVYKQSSGLHPKLVLYTGGSAEAEDACELSNDDLVCEVLQSNEHVTAKILSWEVASLAQKYQEACKLNNQAPISTILSVCRQSATTGMVDLKNQGFLNCHLQPLVHSLEQQEITSILLPANGLHDNGMSSLCESLQRNLVVGSPNNSLTELDVSCTKISQLGIRKLAQAAETGVLKNLRELNISCNNLGDLCAKELATILGSCTGLGRVRAARCRFTHKLLTDCQTLQSALQKCVYLTTLDISHNAFGSVGTELLLKSLPQTSITSLCLSSVCDLKNNFLLVRHVLLYFNRADCQLNTLRLSSNFLTTERLLEFISGLGRIPSLPLRSIDLSKNATSLGDECRLKHELSKISDIDEISVQKNHHKWEGNSTLSKRIDETNDVINACPILGHC